MGTYHPILILVPDLRRVNEAAAIHDAGGVTVLMRRPGVAWDGHVNELPAHLAQRRDDVRAATLGCWYSVDDTTSLMYSAGSQGCDNLRRTFFDRVVDNTGLPDVDLKPHAVALIDNLDRSTLPKGHR